jgi:hypothetical protein
LRRITTTKCLSVKRKVAAAVLVLALGIGAFAAYELAGTTPTTYATEIAYTKTRPAFKVERRVAVTTAAQLRSAISDIRPGDLVTATSAFTVRGETIIDERLPARAEIDLTAGVEFVYDGRDNLPALWLANAENLDIFGGDLSTSDRGGDCVRWTGSQHVLWWGFTLHDCGGTGLDVFTLKPGANGAGPVEGNDIQGEIWKTGQHRAWDPHVEKCTGLHGANLADANYEPFEHNRIALDVHDTACSGAAIEFGSSRATHVPSHNTIILTAADLSFVSKTQTGGNCFGTWGYGIRHTDIKYLQCDNVAGHPYWAHGMFQAAGGRALATDTVEFGRARDVRLNPRYASDADWDTTDGTVFQDVVPPGGAR